MTGGHVQGDLLAPEDVVSLLIDDPQLQQKLKEIPSQVYSLLALLFLCDILIYAYVERLFSFMFQKVLNCFLAVFLYNNIFFNFLLINYIKSLNHV